MPSRVAVHIEEGAVLGWKMTSTVPTGPLRCLAMMISALEGWS